MDLFLSTAPQYVQLEKRLYSLYILFTDVTSFFVMWIMSDWRAIKHEDSLDTVNIIYYENTIYAHTQWTGGYSHNTCITQQIHAHLHIITIMTMTFGKTITLIGIYIIHSTATNIVRLLHELVYFMTSKVTKWKYIHFSHWHKTSY